MKYELVYSFWNPILDFVQRIKPIEADSDEEAIRKAEEFLAARKIRGNAGFSGRLRSVSEVHTISRID